MMWSLRAAVVGEMVFKPEGGRHGDREEKQTGQDRRGKYRVQKAQSMFDEYVPKFSFLSLTEIFKESLFLKMLFIKKMYGDLVKVIVS